MTLKFRAVHTDIHWQRPDASQISCTMRRQYTSSFCEVSGAQLEAIAQIGNRPCLQTHMSQSIWMLWSWN